MLTKIVTMNQGELEICGFENDETGEKTYSIGYLNKSERILMTGKQLFFVYESLKDYFKNGEPVEILLGNQQKKFRLSGKMVFMAQDIDDAFTKLANHFRDLSQEGDGIELLPGTNVTIDPVKARKT